MSNRQARKARKASGVRFHHPEKVGTPFQLRLSFRKLSPKRQAEAARKRGYGSTPEEAES